ncbi:homoserine O-succinyltransferase [Neomegalonema perideroedes]|uniref:homoserine O-succinyltransferase n=1 Tax=Neomegalonema perideroedes TaxID=217219 RepID=UPI0003747EC6|nr:homoserine O-succinyltransferase [Neomegalonema perideroedes]
MPIRIPAHLPARDVLEREGVMVMTEDFAARQDIRPLQIALLNLMPNKIRTETQFARLVGSSPLQIELSLMSVDGYAPRNVSAEHMLNFYQPWSELQDRKFDGLIVTGAPIETMPFEEVSYWPELERIFEWSRSNVHSLFSICWGAQAALRHFHGTPKHELPHKAFGVYDHRNLAPSSHYLRGFSDDFSIPVSRWTEVRKEDLPPDAGLRVLMESDEAGLCMLEEPHLRRLYMFNHIEYDSQSLAEEYRRDVERGEPVAVPANYFPDDDPTREPKNRWRSHAHLLFGNWINEVYQTTWFDMSKIGQNPEDYHGREEGQEGGEGEGSGSGGASALRARPRQAV